MAIAKFSPFWILPTSSDPTAKLGSGLRKVDASIGTKWVRVRDVSGKTQKITKRTWEGGLIPHTPFNPDESLSEVLTKLRGRPASCPIKVSPKMKGK